MFPRPIRFALICAATISVALVTFGQDMTVHGIALGSDFETAKDVYSTGYIKTDAVFYPPDKGTMDGFIATRWEGSDSDPVEKEEYLVQAINGKVVKLESVLYYYYSYKMPNTQDTLASLKQKYGARPSEETAPSFSGQDEQLSWAYDASGSVKPIDGDNAIVCVGSQGDMFSSTRHFLSQGGNPFGLGMSVEYDMANQCSRSAYAAVRPDEQNPQLANRIHLVLIDQGAFQALFAERGGQKQKQQDIEGQRAKGNKPNL
jgi:hypothetical protein